MVEGAFIDDMDSNRFFNNEIKEIQANHQSDQQERH